MVRGRLALRQRAAIAPDMRDRRAGGASERLRPSVRGDAQQWGMSAMTASQRRELKDQGIPVPQTGCRKGRPYPTTERPAKPL